MHFLQPQTWSHDVIIPAFTGLASHTESSCAYQLDVANSTLCGLYVCKVWKRIKYDKSSKSHDKIDKKNVPFLNGPKNFKVQLIPTCVLPTLTLNNFWLNCFQLTKLERLEVNSDVLTSVEFGNVQTSTSSPPGGSKRDQIRPDNHTQHNPLNGCKHLKMSYSWNQTWYATTPSYYLHVTKSLKIIRSFKLDQNWGPWGWFDTQFWSWTHEKRVCINC